MLSTSAFGWDAPRVSLPPHSLSSVLVHVPVADQRSPRAQELAARHGLPASAQLCGWFALAAAQLAAQLVSGRTARRSDVCRLLDALRPLEASEPAARPFRERDNGHEHETRSSFWDELDEALNNVAAARRQYVSSMPWEFRGSTSTSASSSLPPPLPSSIHIDEDIMEEAVFMGARVATWEVCGWLRSQGRDEARVSAGFAAERDEVGTSSWSGPQTAFGDGRRPQPAHFGGNAASPGGHAAVVDVVGIARRVCVSQAAAGFLEPGVGRLLSSERLFLTEEAPFRTTMTGRKEAQFFAEMSAASALGSRMQVLGHAARVEPIPFPPRGDVERSARDGASSLMRLPALLAPFSSLGVQAQEAEGAGDGRTTCSHATDKGIPHIWIVDLDGHFVVAVSLVLRESEEDCRGKGKDEGQAEGKGVQAERAAAPLEQAVTLVLDSLPTSKVASELGLLSSSMRPSSPGLGAGAVGEGDTTSPTTSPRPTALKLSRGLEVLALVHEAVHGHPPDSVATERALGLA
jgi:hypothetical protein